LTLRYQENLSSTQTVFAPSQKFIAWLFLQWSDLDFHSFSNSQRLFGDFLGNGVFLKKGFFAEMARLIGELVNKNSKLFLDSIRENDLIYYDALEISYLTRWTITKIDESQESENPLVFCHRPYANMSHALIRSEVVFKRFTWHWITNCNCCPVSYTGHSEVTTLEGNDSKTIK
jgi:hypothetical protein